RFTTAVPTSSIRGQYTASGRLRQARVAAHFMLALIAAIASAWEYSWLATLPFSILGRLARRSSCVNARYGTKRSCGTSLLPSRICCATQKASVETPGAIEADHVV